MRFHKNGKLIMFQHLFSLDWRRILEIPKFSISTHEISIWADLENLSLKTRPPVSKLIGYCIQTKWKPFSLFLILLRVIQNVLMGFPEKNVFARVCVCVRACVCVIWLLIKQIWPSRLGCRVVGVPMILVPP